jgi:hypothetical protein
VESFTPMKKRNHEIRKIPNITFRVDPLLVNRLEAARDKTGSSVGAIIRQALMAYLPQIEKYKGRDDFP